MRDFYLKVHRSKHGCFYDFRTALVGQFNHLIHVLASSDEDCLVIRIHLFSCIDLIINIIIIILNIIKKKRIDQLKLLNDKIILNQLNLISWLNYYDLVTNKSWVPIYMQLMSWVPIYLMFSLSPCLIQYAILIIIPLKNLCLQK